MSGTILLGYDIETASETTLGFMEGAELLHDELDVPWTIYLTGATVEEHGAALRRYVENPRLTLCQHTYSHMLLRSVFMVPGDGKSVHGPNETFFIRGGSLEEIRAEIAKTQALMRDQLGIECRGLTGPWGYYRGLVHRPDILEVMQENGIHWLRTNARDSRDCQPTPFTEQPYFYTDLGFPDILELGLQGYQDDFYWARFDDRRHGPTYQDYLYAMIDEVAEHDWIWNVDSHDHETPTKEAFFETKGKWLGDFIVRAKDRGLRFAAPAEIYEEMKAATRTNAGEEQG